MTEARVLFTSVILSIIVTVSAGVSCTKVVCLHNGTYNICIFEIFSKIGFLDIVPLCSQPSNCCVLQLSAVTAVARWWCRSEVTWDDVSGVKSSMKPRELSADTGHWGTGKRNQNSSATSTRAACDLQFSQSQMFSAKNWPTKATDRRRSAPMYRKR